ncbi:MAG: hypothetical protein ACI4R8_02825 [Candidatus Caccovivens sp.]
MHYPKVKVYFDGGHYIGIPQTPQIWKKRKNKKKPTNDTMKVRFDELYKENRALKNKEKQEIIVNKLTAEFESEEKAREFVKKNFERKRRNDIERRKRLYRKVYLQEWNYFCTFTYDDKKLNETEFREKLTNCLRHLANRNGWKYVGVWERSPLNNRLHFHSLVYAPQMVGIFETKTDYSTEKHKMQTTNQNTFFLQRFGRNDFKIINDFELNQAVKYLTKYMEKSGEKIVYSKGLKTYFVSEIIESDIVCTIGNENRKLLLFDDFYCIVDDECIGKVCLEVIQKMPKSN